MKRWLALLLGGVTACAVRSATPPSPAADSIDPRMVFGTDAERQRCEEILAGIDCPEQTEPDVFLGPMSEEGSAFCSIVCKRGGVEHGPYVVRNVSTDDYEESGRYADGEPQGRWVHRVRDRERDEWRLVSVRHYDRGKLDGRSRAWHPNGEPRYDGLLVQGDKHGEWTEWNPRGVMISHGYFDRGTRVGAHERRYQNGRLQSREVFDEEGRPHGEFCFWNQDGALLECYEIEFGTGTLRHYTEEGKLLSETQMKDGKPHGESVTYLLEDSKVIESYRDGVPHGPGRVVEGDCVAFEKNFSDGREHGPYTERDCSSDPPVVVTEGAWCDGAMCGRWTKRDPETGQITRVTEYAADGTMLSETLYEEGAPIDHRVYDGSPP